MVTIRPAGPADASFLEEVLAVAADWRLATPRPVAEVLAEPANAHYVAGWPRPGDVGVVAVAEEGRPVGAAWWRTFDHDDHGYGFVDPATPELSIGVVAGARRRGIGGRLLAALVDEARRRSLPALSLSVEVDNPAVRLYERLGFRPVATAQGAHTMVLPLTG